ncbi:MAG: hypothetical protein IJQ83_05625 [Bacteroidales bacterium]|nr:hypothetical protein [Bacteroidales bacterium]
MKNEQMQITDELIACYLEGKVTEEERKAVEAYLSENDEEMDFLFEARAEMAYQDDIAHQSVFARSMVDYNEYALAASSEKMDCAIRAQQMVLRNYGVEVSVEELTALAKKQGWFEEGKGSAFDFVGELLNYYGVETVQMRNAGVYHIMHELSQGHKIIVGVDADAPSDTALAQHVMLVAGIDTTDPDRLKVVVRDPSHPESDETYTASDFMERWKQTGCFMVSTKQPAPLSANPEMQHFDYELGYVRKFADVAYEEIIKRLAEDGYISDPALRQAQGSESEASGTAKKIRFYVIGLVALLLLGCFGYYHWRSSTPLQMKVNVTEDKDYSIPSLPFAQGTLQCEYADNAVQTLKVSADNATVFLNEISYKYRNSDVHVVFEADGYQTIDTVVKVQKSLNLSIKRNNDLGVVFGRVVDFETEQPIEGATISLQDMTIQTDAFGQFRIEIPFAKQDKTQRVRVTKEGYQVWEGMYRPSATEPWHVVLMKE